MIKTAQPVSLKQAAAAVTVLRDLFVCCDPADYVAGCPSCEARRLADSIESMIADCWREEEARDEGA